MVQKLYDEWLNKIKNEELLKELIEIKGNQEEINDRFYKSLQFGTAGLRGIIGAGTNRMNIYTVGHATQGLADYVNSVNKNGSVAIAYDCRIKSYEFAKTTAEVFAANGVKVYIYKELMPTPMLSFAVRHLKCDAGVVITASHNPSKYNGYKAYGSDGSQLGLKESAYVTDIIEKVDIFTGVKKVDFDKALSEGIIEYIGDDVIEAYLDAVQAQSVSDSTYDFKNLHVIYTPLHGTGNKPVRAILKRIGVNNVTVVPEQEKPDGRFPTLPFPNPEFKEAFDCALKVAEKTPADLLLATDPDSDRVGIALFDKGEYKLISGNQMGALLMNYLLERKTELGILPKNPIAVKTIVSTKLCYPICEKYGCKLIDVLTGFKFIGGEILKLENIGEQERFIFGFEESYGYLAGGYVRDKDAVVGSMLICEMVCYYKAKGLTILDVLNNLYKEFGYCFDMQRSITCEGQSGMQDMQNAMARLKSEYPSEIAGKKVVTVKDYSAQISTDITTEKTSKIDLPASEVLAYELEDKSSVTIRPSGTEPKIKIYVSAIKKDEQTAKAYAQELVKGGIEILGL